MIRMITFIILAVIATAFSNNALAQTAETKIECVADASWPTGYTFVRVKKIYRNVWNNKPLDKPVWGQAGDGWTGGPCKKGQPYVAPVKELVQRNIAILPRYVVGTLPSDSILYACEIKTGRTGTMIMVWKNGETSRRDNVVCTDTRS